MANEKTPAQLAYEADEEQRKNQVQFDSKVHGVGTAPINRPSSVKEMYEDVVVPLVKRVEELESKMASLIVKSKTPVKPAKQENPPVQ